MSQTSQKADTTEAAVANIAEEDDIVMTHARDNEDDAFSAEKE